MTNQAGHAAVLAGPGVKCDNTPADAAGESCVTNENGQLKIAPGFTVPKPIASSRRRNLADDSRASETPAETLVFRCHPEIDVARVRCPGGAASGARAALQTVHRTCLLPC